MAAICRRVVRHVETPVSFRPVVAAAIFRSMPKLLDDLELLDRLIAFDSTSRNSNLPIADFICDYVDAPHVRVDRLPSAVTGVYRQAIRLG